MDDDEDVDQAATEQSGNDLDGPWNDYAAPQAQAQPSGPWDDYAPAEEKGPWDDYKEPTSMLGDFVRGVRGGILPTIASTPFMGAGAKLGAMGGTAVGGPVGGIIGGVVGGLAGAVAGGMAASKVQDVALGAAGLRTEAQEQADASNPLAYGAGNIASGLAVFNPGKLGDSLVQRLLGAGLMGGLNVGEQLGTKGEVDLREAGMSAAAGALLNRTNRLGARGMKMGESWVPPRSGEGVALPPAPDPAKDKLDASSSETLKTSVGNAQAQAAPNESVTGVGNQQSAPTRSGREYVKKPRLSDRDTTAPAEGQVTETQPGELPPDVAAAIENANDGAQVKGNNSPENGGINTPATAEPPVSTNSNPNGQNPAQTGGTNALPNREPGRTVPVQMEPPPAQPIRRPEAPRSPEGVIEVSRLEREAASRVHERIAEQQKGEAFVPEQEQAPIEPAKEPAKEPVQEPVQRAPRVLEDIRSEPETAREPTGTGEASPPTPEPRGKKAPGVHPIRDPEGNPIPGSNARSEAAANRKSTSIRLASEIMDKHKDFADRYDPSKPEDVVMMRKIAREIINEAKDSGWTEYLGRSKTADPHLQSRRESLWMDELLAFTAQKQDKKSGKMKDAPKREPADFAQRMVHLKTEEGADLVRQQRLEEGDRIFLRPMTEEGHKQTARNDLMGGSEIKSEGRKIDPNSAEGKAIAADKGGKLTPEELAAYKEKKARLTGAGKLAPSFGRRGLEARRTTERGGEGDVRGAVYTGENENIRVKTTKPSEKLSDVLKPDEQMFIGGEFTDHYSEIARRLVAEEPNVPVHHVSRETMAKVWPDRPANRAPHGMYDFSQHAIFLTEGADHNTLLHESLHAALGRKIEADPKYKAEIRELMNAADHDGTFTDMYPHAMENEHEFLAWGMSEPSVMSTLARTRIPEPLAKKLGLSERVKNMWDAFVETARRILGLGPEHHSALEGVIKLVEKGLYAPKLTDAQTTSYREMQSREVRQLAQHVQEVRDDADGMLRQAKAPWLLRVRDTGNIVRAADPLFGGAKDNPLRKVFDHTEQGRIRALELAKDSAPLEKRGLELREQDPDEWAELEKLIQDESYFQRYGDRALNAQGFRTHGPEKAYRDSKHADLEQRWNNRTTESKEWRDEFYDFMVQRNQDIMEGLASNRLFKDVGINDPALAKRVMEDTHTEADFQRLGANDRERQGNLEFIQEVMSRGQVIGPYSPFIRRGSFISKGLYKVVDTGKEVQNSPNVTDSTREFKTQADAEEFAKGQHSSTKVHSYYVDATSGERYHQVMTDVLDAKGKQVLDPQGNVRKAPQDVAYKKGDKNVEKRWLGTVERGYLRMHETYRDALEHESDLKQSGIYEDGSTDASKKAYRPDRDAVALAGNGHIENLLRHNSTYQSLGAEGKESVRQLLAEQRLQALAGTRSTSSKLHRNYVRGSDDNILHNFVDYSRETSNQKALLEHQGEIDAGLERAKEMVGENNHQSFARQRVYNEIASRMNDMKGGGFSLAAGQMSPALHRLHSWSYMARLATPGFTIRNLTQVPLMGWSELGGRHGPMGAGRALMKAYKDINAGSILLGGMKETGKAAAGKLTDPLKFVDDIKNRLSDAGEKKAIDEYVKNGNLDADAGFQVAEFIARGRVRLNLMNLRKDNAGSRALESGLTAADKALHWMEEVSRQMPRAAEVVNRAVTGLGAYRLELKRNGGDVDAAIQYGKDTLDNTQFRYSDTNKPTWQRNPFARTAFQFKQFGKSTYEFLGRHIGVAISRESDPEMRKAALKSLGLMFVSHTIMAGALGLPWEPVRAMLIGAKAAGITNKEWDDVENSIREGLTGVGKLAGFNEKNSKKVGEAMARGMPRLLNMDMSPGLGMENLLLFGSPRSGTDRDYDTNLSAWMFQMAGGAAGSLGIQALHGLRDMLGGDYANGLAKLSILKIGSDVIKAEEGYRKGKVNARGRQTMEPYSFTEAATKAMGIPVGREAEVNAYQHATYQKGQEIKDAKSKAVANWLAASPEGKTTAAKAAVDAGVKPVELTQALTRERNARQRDTGGVITNKTTKPIAERLRGVYNTER